MKLVERWYVGDEKSNYRLKDPDEVYSNLISRSVSTLDLHIIENEEWNENYNNLIEIFLNVQQNNLLSVGETIWNFSMKISSSSCLFVLRQIDGKFLRNQNKSLRETFSEHRHAQRKTRLVFSSFRERFSQEIN